MLTATAFKYRFLRFLRLMIETGAYVDLSYKGKIYRLHIENIYRSAPRRKYSRRAGGEAIQTGKCEACGNLLINGVCMNATCPTIDP